MAKRRPSRVEHVVKGWGIPRKEAEAVIKGLKIKGFLSSQDHSGGTFSTCRVHEKEDESE